MPRIKVITFDLDDTLWDVQRVLRGAEKRLTAWLEDHAPAAAALYRNGEDVLAMRQDLIAAQPHLAHDISRLREEILFVLLRRVGYREASARQVAARAFSVFLEARHDIEFFEGALEALHDLCQRYTLGSLTNGNADPKKLKLDRYLSFSFCAADVGASKPAPDLFYKALRHNDVSPGEAVHVGDHPSHDIAAAASVGMHTVWTHGPAQRSKWQVGLSALPTVAITHLNELVGAVERIEGL